MSTEKYHNVIRSVPAEAAHAHSQFVVGLRGVKSRTSKPNVVSRSAMKAGQGLVPRAWASLLEENILARRPHRDEAGAHDVRARGRRASGSIY